MSLYRLQRLSMSVILSERSALSVLWFMAATNALVFLKLGNLEPSMPGRYVPALCAVLITSWPMFLSLATRSRSHSCAHMFPTNSSSTSNVTQGKCLGQTANTHGERNPLSPSLNLRSSPNNDIVSSLECTEGSEAELLLRSITMMDRSRTASCPSTGVILNLSKQNMCAKIRCEVVCKNVSICKALLYIYI